MLWPQGSLMLSGLPQDMGEHNNDRVIPARTSPGSTRSASGAREPGQPDEKWEKNQLQLAPNPIPQNNLGLRAWHVVTHTSFCYVIWSVICDLNNFPVSKTIEWSTLRPLWEKRILSASYNYLQANVVTHSRKKCSAVLCPGIKLTQDIIGTLKHYIKNYIQHP